MLSAQLESDVAKKKADGEGGSAQDKEREASPPPKKIWLMGIGWVVKCVEKKVRVVEDLYQLDVAQEEIVFGKKVRSPPPPF